MKPYTIFLSAGFIITMSCTSCRQMLPVPDSVIQEAFAGRSGTFVMIDCESGCVSDSNPSASSEKLPPCSTFKIWNTLIGLEAEIISDPDKAFYKWDGVKRSIEDWNKDLTLQEAFRASCVPAFQDLAGKIGQARMQDMINKIGYGDCDLSAGIDVFWLPSKGRKTVLISPQEQAGLMNRLASGKLPFSAKSLATLKDIMRSEKTQNGILYGKTGSRADENGRYDMGWFVGYAENNGKTYAFACNLKGANVTGKDAREVSVKILKNRGIL